MANKNILIKKDVIEEKEGVAILDLKKYRDIRERLEEYQRKEKLLRSLEKFEKLAKWGKDFAKKRRITPKQVLENDYSF
jgi:hypothetical protein